MTLFAHMRHRLEGAAGIADRAHAGKTWEQLLAQQRADGFTEKMDARMVMGELRYGGRRNREREKPPFYDVKEAERRLGLYRATGNTEHLVDAANFLRLEARNSRHPNKHFRALDRE